MVANVGMELLASGALVLLYIGLTLPAVRTLTGSLLGPDLLLLSAVAGIGVQSMLGLLWNHLVGRRPEVEAAIYVLFWVALWLGLRRTARPPLAPDGTAQRPSAAAVTCLAVVLAAGFALRSIHPLLCPALGQSDAYSHLQFIRYVLADGHIPLTVYPPGYHWVMALPTLLLRVDPYLLARYGGAFFGCLLILVFWRLGRSTTGGDQGVLAAYLVACFPGAMLLIKTGVGAYPNQLGLVLVPFIFGEYLLLLHRGSRLHAWCIALATLSLIACVPLMVIDVALVVMAERMLAVLSGDTQWLRRYGRVILFAMIILCAVAGFHVFRSDSRNLAFTASLVAGITPGDTSLGRTLCVATVDFLRLKRVGLGSPFMDGACVLLGLGFAACLWHGVRHRSVAFKLLGLWGIVATLQTSVGALQFDWYQRAGWHLLEAAAWLGSTLLVLIGDRIPARRIPRVAVVIVLLAAAVFSFAHYPRHTLLISTAESEIADIVRALSGGAESRQEATGWTAARREDLSFLRDLDPRHPLVLVARRFSGHAWNHGDPVCALLDPSVGIQVVSYGGAVRQLELKPGRQYLVLIDRYRPFTTEELGPTARLSPSLAKSFIKSTRELYAANEALLAELDRVPRAQWQICEHTVTTNLTVYTITPRRQPIEPRLH